MAEYINKIDILTRQYNDAITALEESYDMESSQQGLLQKLTSSKLKRQYSEKYEELAQEYFGKRKTIFEEYKKANPQWTKTRKIWGRVFYIGIIFAMVCCSAAMPWSEEPSFAETSQVVSDPQETTLWNAENIPIPFLQDSTQYVSNPDHVLTQQTVDHMNITLKRLDNELGVQSIVIVVNHIENDDPFRFAQDVGNKYGVGYGNKGLMVVVGYQDHSINISPGRALEADLTDAECHRLEQQYVVPAMRAEMPDSAMFYLTEALYSTLQKKQLPQMSKCPTCSLLLTMMWMRAWQRWASPCWSSSHGVYSSCARIANTTGWEWQEQLPCSPIRSTKKPTAVAGVVSEALAEAEVTSEVAAEDSAEATSEEAPSVVVEPRHVGNHKTHKTYKTHNN